MGATYSNIRMISYAVSRVYKWALSETAGRSAGSWITIWKSGLT